MKINRRNQLPLPTSPIDIVFRTTTGLQYVGWFNGKQFCSAFAKTEFVDPSGPRSTGYAVFSVEDVVAWVEADEIPLGDGATN